MYGWYPAGYGARRRTAAHIEGMTNGEIAETLDIAPKTASGHVEHILAKLGASRRAEIATWASNVQARSSGLRRPPVEQPTQV